MNDQRKSWQALGLLGLALTAGAIRLGDKGEERTMTAFSTAPVSAERAARCDARLDPAWFEACLDPESPRLAGR
jgi:hypothetical protein